MTAHAKAMAELYRLALFAPGANGATFANILLRAARIVDDPHGEPGGDAALKSDLDALRADIEARQKRLELVHDTLAGADEPTHRQAQGSRIARDAARRAAAGDPAEDPGR